LAIPPNLGNFSGKGKGPNLKPFGGENSSPPKKSPPKIFLGETHTSTKKKLFPKKPWFIKTLFGEKRAG